MDAREGRIVVGRLRAIEEVDDGACALLGYTPEELLRMHGADLVPDAERPAVAVSLDRMQEGALASREGRIVRKDGTVVAVEVQARPLPGERLEMRLRALG
jgi:PAS domain S-box-containing protein